MVDSAYKTFSETNLLYSKIRFSPTTTLREKQPYWKKKPLNQTTSLEFAVSFRAAEWSSRTRKRRCVTTKRLSTFYVGFPSHKFTIRPSEIWGFVMEGCIDHDVQLDKKEDDHLNMWVGVEKIIYQQLEHIVTQSNWLLWAWFLSGSFQILLRCVGV